MADGRTSSRASSRRVGRDPRTRWTAEDDPENRWSLWSVGSTLSVGSVDSVLSIGSHSSVLSIGSLGSAVSVLSIGSAASVASVASAASRGSLFSAASTASAFSIDSHETVAGGSEHGSAGWAPGAAVAALGVLMLADWWRRHDG